MSECPRTAIGEEGAPCGLGGACNTERNLTCCDNIHFLGGLTSVKVRYCALRTPCCISADLMMTAAAPAAAAAASCLLPRSSLPLPWMLLPPLLRCCCCLEGCLTQDHLHSIAVLGIHSTGSFASIYHLQIPTCQHSCDGQLP